MTKKITAAVIIALAALTANAQKITFMPQWTPQAQFAGYYVAMEKGFYKEAGIDVEFKHLSSNTKLNCMDHLRNGEVDVVTSMLSSSIIARGNGNKLVNILQTSQNTGLCCVAHKPISKLEDLDGMSIGRWKSGFGENATIAQMDLGLDIKWVPYLYGISLFIANAVDATLCYSFNELIQLYLAIGEIPIENIIFFKDLDYNYPEDGLYVSDSFYRTRKEDAKAFAEASKRGWDYCRDHMQEALDIVMKYTDFHHIKTNRIHQEMMLKVVLLLQENKESGKADYAPVSEALFNELSEKGFKAGIFPVKVAYKDIIAQ